MLKNGTPASPATAFARSVLPVPGGPVRITPFGILAPNSVYFTGFFKKSTISSSSSFSSWSPATFLNVTCFPISSISFALLLPKFIILVLEPPPDCLEVKNTISPIVIIHIRNGHNILIHVLCLTTSLT